MSNSAIVKALTKTHSPLDSSDHSKGESGDDSVISLDDFELANLEMWAKKLRNGYLLASGIMSFAAFFSLGTNDLALLFSAIYVWFFAVLIFCFELALSVVSKQIAENFGFMYNPLFRGIFLVFVMMLCFELGLLGKIAMCMLAVISISHKLHLQF